LFLQGTKLIEKAFNANQRSAAAANALCELFLRKANHKRVRTSSDSSFTYAHGLQALKLAERTIQFADTLTVLTEGYLKAGRVSHAEGSLVLATKYYSSAIEGHPKHVLAAIGLAQLQMQNGCLCFFFFF
jgi:RNA polymerase-associated protein CTR9